MPATKSSTENAATSAEEAFQAPIAAAKKFLEDIKPNFDALKNFDPATSFSPEAVRTQVIDGIKQANKVALDAASSVSEMVAKVAPTQTLPFATQIQEAAKANFAFMGQLLDLQRDFATELLATLVPAK